MKRAELSGKTVNELRTLAKKLKIVLAATANRSDIVRALVKAGTGEEPATKPKARGKTKAKAKTKAKPKIKAAAKAKGKAGRKTGTLIRTAATTSEQATKKRVFRKGAAPATKGQRSVRGVREPLASQERIEDAKFYTGPEGMQHPFIGSLPLEYGEERITLLARDPNTLFCYWEVPKARLDKERSRQGKGSRLCVRMYDVTGIEFDGRNATSFFDQEVYERIGSWYFDLHRPAHAFCADIGLRTPGGRFRTIARSNLLVTPPGGVSDMAEVEWSLTEEQLLRIFGAAAEGAGGLSSEQLREWFRLQRGAAISSPGISSWGLPGSGRR